MHEIKRERERDLDIGTEREREEENANQITQDTLDYTIRLLNARGCNL